MPSDINNTNESVKKPEPEAKREHRKEDVETLIQAFEYFTETSERLRESYDTLQEKISHLDLELEKKNQELSSNLREKDSIKNYLENILESMTLGVVVVDLDGNVNIVNRAAYELTGFSSDDLIDKHYSETLGKKMQVEFTPLYPLRTGLPKRNKEKDLHTKEGVSIPVEFSTSMVANERGEPIGALEIFTDLREIKQLQEQVQQAKTLSALGEMAANVAHELRNPLGGIGGYAALLQRDLEGDDPRRQLVQKIVEGVEKLNRIATNLLVYTRPMRPQKRPVDIVQVVEEVLLLIQVELEQDEIPITIEKKYNEKEELEVPIDPELFQQVFLNLTKNAVQAMENEGVMVVGIENLKKTEQIEISVEDSGVGMSEENIKKLFLPFFTTKADGTGLGLSIVKKIMDTHGGEIVVESEEGTGTIFRVRFPY